MKAILTTLRHLLEGFAMGIANVIPGVSGGTMALVLGIYESLIGATSTAVRAGTTVLRRDWRIGLADLRALPWRFLVPLVVGMVSAPLLGAGLIERLLAEHPEAMRGLFFGLILGSLPVPWLRTRRRDLAVWLLAVAAAVTAYLLVGLPPREVVDPTWVHVLGAAALAITAMILPGVSGAFLLLVMGMYAPTLTALDSLDLGFLAVFAVGAAAGLAVFSVFLNWLINHHHDLTMAVLVGLMAGSLRALWPWQTGGLPRLPGLGEPVTAIALLALAGCLVSAVLTVVEYRRIRRSRSVSA